MTYQDALNKAKEKIDSLDAELILGFIQNQTREKIFTNLNSDLSSKKFQNFYELVEKRRKGFPLAYITGKKEFFFLGYDREPTLKITQTAPLPLKVLGVALEVVF